MNLDKFASVLPHCADAAALMLAAVDDRAGLDATLKTLTVGEAAELLLSAVEVGGSLVRVSESIAAQGGHSTPRDILACLVEACRTDVAS